MIRKHNLNGGSDVEVTFEVPTREFGHHIFIAGDFNAWDYGASPMEPDGEVERVIMVLAAGRRYAFRYFRAGSWFNDPGADDYEPNEFGGLNGIVDLG
jgi:hypothetical protein